MAYIGINFVVGEIRLDVSIVVAHARLRNRVNLCLGLHSSSRVIRWLPGLRIVLGVLLRAESETSASGWSGFVGTRLGWFGAALRRWVGTRGRSRGQTTRQSGEDAGAVEKARDTGAQIIVKCLESRDGMDRDNDIV